jgi:hypothetical protein
MVSRLDFRPLFRYTSSMIIAGFSWRSLFPSWSTIVLDVWKYILLLIKGLLFISTEEAFFMEVDKVEFLKRIKWKIQIFKDYGLYYIDGCGPVVKIALLDKVKIQFVIKIIVIRPWFNFENAKMKSAPPPLQCQSLRELEKFIMNWYDSKEWFESKKIDHRLGILLYGPPGTGKSRFIKRIYKLLYNQNHNLSLNNGIEAIGDKYLVNVNSKPSVTYFEDFDRLYHGDKGVKESLPSFQFLLGSLDIINGIVFITVNDITKLDPAIAQLTEDGRISRPGRIDRVVYVGVADEQGRRDCAAHILSEWPDLIDKVVHEGEGETIAQFSDRCKTLAVKMYWQSQVDKPTDLK